MHLRDAVKRNMIDRSKRLDLCSVLGQGMGKWQMGRAEKWHDGGLEGQMEKDLKREMGWDGSRDSEDRRVGDGRIQK